MFGAIFLLPLYAFMVGTGAPLLLNGESYLTPCNHT